MKYIYYIFLFANLVNQNCAFTLSKHPTHKLNTVGRIYVSSYNDDHLIVNVDTMIEAEQESAQEVAQESAQESAQEASIIEQDLELSEDKTKSSCVLFYTGKLNNGLPSDIYNTFLNKLADTKKIYIASSSADKNLALVNKITNTDKLSIISHSTSANDAIELMKQIENTQENAGDNIENLILIDPIDHYYFKDNFDFNQYNVFKYLDSMEDMEEKISTFIEADKVNLVFSTIFKPGKNKKKVNKKTLILKSSISNRWKIFPPIPPINKYSLNLNQLKNKKIKSIENYGHFDILDSTWSNMIHNTFSRGSPSRDSSNLENYHDILIEHINEFQ